MLASHTKTVIVLPTVGMENSLDTISNVDSPFVHEAFAGTALSAHSFAPAGVAFTMI